MGVPIIDPKFNTVDYSKEVLLTYFPKGSTAWLVIRQVSRSGMYRHISVHGIKNNKVLIMSPMSSNGLTKTKPTQSVLVGVEWIWVSISSILFQVSFTKTDTH